MIRERRKFSWIFFDLDGTIADSIPASYKAHIDFLAKFGITGDKEEFEELNGLSLPETVTILKRKYRLVAEGDHLINLYRSEITDAYRDHIKPFDGLSDILEELENREYKLVLVTSADREIAMEFINNQKLGKYFQNYVFGDEVKKAKPDSEIYALALKRIDASSNSVVVIEDSYNGIRSAKRAGTFVVGLANNQTKEDLLKAGADIAISKLKDILSILGPCSSAG